jgi:peptidoglycan/xylan/chitin deacetylase (PgdA/CDA1 family)
VLENWLDDFRYMVRETERGVLTYTVHPQVIGRGHRMLMLERLIDGLNEMEARFARLDEALGEMIS